MINDLTIGVPVKRIIGLSIPMILASVFQQLYNTVDAIIVGNYIGSDALAAVGLSFPIIFLLVSIITGISMGVSTIIAQYFGAKQYQAIKQTIGTAVIFLLLATLILSGIGFIFSEQFLKWMGTPDALLREADGYLKIIFAGAVFTLLYNVFSAILRGVGDVKSPLYFLLLAMGLNVVLDIVFITVFHMGLEGAALATIISQAIASIFCMTYIHNKIPFIRMPLKAYRFYKTSFVLILKFGVPSAIQQGIVSIGLILIQGVVNAFGTNVIAGYTVATRIDSFITLPYMNISLALSSFVGQNIGAGNIERVKLGLISTLKIVMILSMIILPVLWFGGELLSGAFLDRANIEAFEISTKYLRDLAAFYFALGIAYTILGMLRGAGDNTWVMIINAFSLLSRVGAAYWITDVIGVRGLWFATAIGWFVALIMAFFRFKSNRWESQSITLKEREQCL
jgi:putative MATE family efflux protein